MPIALVAEPAATEETPNCLTRRAMRNVNSPPQMIPSRASYLLTNGEMEHFSVYRFSMDYPAVCRFEFNPKTRREKGDIVVHFPDKEKIFLSWGVLATVTKKFQAANDFAKHGIKSMSKSRNISKTDKLEEKTITVNSHEAFYNKVQFHETAAMGLFSKGRTNLRTTCSVHFYCPTSSRYFVIYALLTPNAPEDFDELFLEMVESFRCH